MVFEVPRLHKCLDKENESEVSFKNTAFKKPKDSKEL